MTLSVYFVDRTHFMEINSFNFAYYSENIFVDTSLLKRLDSIASWLDAEPA